MDAQMSRRLLSVERERLLRVRRGLESEHPHEPDAENAAELSALDQHQADLGSEMFEREKDLSILVRVDAELREVTDAMARLDRGAYGACQTCGRLIPEDRLEAVPATRFCVEHEGLWEGNEITAPLPEGVYPDEAAFAEDIAAREGAQHLEFLPTDDEMEEDLGLGPEESALHVTGPAGEPSDTLSPDEVELAEMQAVELEDEERTDAEGEESARRADADAAALEDEQLGVTSRSPASAPNAEVQGRGQSAGRR